MGKRFFYLSIARKGAFLMQDNSTPLLPIPVINGLVVLDGYVKIRVEKGFLEVTDGISDERRHQLFSKATCKIKHVAILDAAGYITFEAFEWLYAIGAGIIQLGWDGEVLLASAPHLDHITIKRAQYAAVDSQDGRDITTYLVTSKAYSQCQVLSKHAPGATYTYLGDTLDTVRFIKRQVSEIERARSIPEVLGLEGLIALAYWETISKIPLHFEKKDTSSIPLHWLTFGARHSLYNIKKNRNATNPANAMLNYLYALLYAETQVALLGAGLDPAAGLFHADNLYRASFAYDVMEAVRPEVDLWLLDFLSTRTFAKKCFFEKRSGVIRLHSDLARELAGTLPQWRWVIEPVVAEVRHILLS
jgi:CRISPR-associated protein Cas1